MWNDPSIKMDWTLFELTQSIAVASGRVQIWEFSCTFFGIRWKLESFHNDWPNTWKFPLFQKIWNAILKIVFFHCDWYFLEKFQFSHLGWVFINWIITLFSLLFLIFSKNDSKMQFERMTEGIMLFNQYSCSSLTIDNWKWEQLSDTSWLWNGESPRKRTWTTIKEGN